jgi:hypothetical protein
MRAAQLPMGRPLLSIRKSTGTTKKRFLMFSSYRNNEAPMSIILRFISWAHDRS